MEKVTFVAPKSAESRNTENLGTLEAFIKAQGVEKVGKPARKVVEDVISDYQQLRLVNADGHSLYITLSKGLSAEDATIGQLMSCEVHKATKNRDGSPLVDQAGNATVAYFVYRPAGSMTETFEVKDIKTEAYVPKKVVVAANVSTADAMALLMAQMQKAPAVAA